MTNGRKKDKKNDLREIFKWFNDYSGFLMLLLIIVTAVVGGLTYFQQKKIYSPLFVPNEYISPKSIQGATQSSFQIWNYGYFGGSYSLKISSKDFYVSKDGRVKEREIIFGPYFIGQGQHLIHTFYLLPPEEDKPKRASFKIEFMDDNGNYISNLILCYELNSDGYYEKIAC